jgi:hypothetical protein
VSSETHALVPHAVDDIRFLRISRAGVLNRKDDVLPGGRKGSNRRWRPYSVALTGSYLLFFRDPALVPQLRPFDGLVPASRSTAFHPEEIFTLNEAIALFDRSYSKVIFNACTPLFRRLFIL